MAPLELPGGEAPDVDVELVQPRIVATIAGELELLVVLGHGLLAKDGLVHLAGCSSAGVQMTPCVL
jgi:hypothetical protein